MPFGRDTCVVSCNIVIISILQLLLELDRQADRHTDRQTDRQTDIQTDRQTQTVMLKPQDGMRCRLAETLVWCQVTLMNTGQSQ